MAVFGEDHAMSTLDNSAGWTYPSATLLIPPVILTLQSSLLFIDPSSSLSPLSSRTFRLAILPLSLYAIWHSCSLYHQSFFHPVRDFVHLNTVIQLSKFWACIRSIEFAICDKDEYKWIGYEKAYEKSDGSKEKQMTHVNGKRNGGHTEQAQPGSKTKSKSSLGDLQDRTGGRNPLLLGWLNLCSLRGIGWQWGIKGTQISPPHPANHFVLSLLFRILWSHLLTVLAVSFVTYHRQHSSKHSGALRTYFPSLPENNTLVQLASRSSQVAVFGLVVYTTLECGYSLLTFSVYILTSFSRFILPSSGLLAYLRPDEFRREAWPRLSNKPIYSSSLADFWGKRWHALFRRIFIVVGARPLSGMIPERLESIVGKGRMKMAKVAFGTLGAFMTSGVLHECFNEATPWLPRDPHYTVFIFFTLQAFGMMFERAIMALLGGPETRASQIFGRIWCWTFLLSTGLLMTECWVDRGIVDNQPPLGEWEWWRWSLPLAFVIPNLNRTRLHQMKHLQS